MAAFDDMTVRADASERAKDMEAGVDYRIGHESRFEGFKSAERRLEISNYETRGYKGQELHEFRFQHEGEFIEPMSRSYAVEKFDDPNRFVASINPRLDDAGYSYKVNCADCARSVERTWRGNHEEAAGRVPCLDTNGAIVPHGEQSSMTEDWAGERFVSTHDDELLRQALLDGGHGSSAIVHSTWERTDQQRAGGHAYNAVNYHGEIRVLDGQIGKSFEWEPGVIHPDLGRNPKHKAIAWNKEGERIW